MLSALHHQGFLTYGQTQEFIRYPVILHLITLISGIFTSLDTIMIGNITYLKASFHFIGSQEAQHFLDSDEFCTNHENCEERHDQIKMTKGFVSKEPVKGHMVSPPFPCYFYMRSGRVIFTNGHFLPSVI